MKINVLINIFLRDQRMLTPGQLVGAVSRTRDSRMTDAQKFRSVRPPPVFCGADS